MAKKNQRQEQRVKLLVCIINKEDEAALVSACNECCVSLHFSGLASGTAKSNYLSYLGLDDIEKRIVYSLIPSYSETKVLGAINRSLRLYLMGKGIAFTIPLSGISSIISGAVLSTPYRDEDNTSKTSQRQEGRNKMHEMIIAVVNQKFTDGVIDCARNAGATGATIIHTHSVGNAQAEQLIGTSLTQETDTIAFLTTHEYKLKIMEAIRQTAGLKTDGGAVLFSLPVDTLIGIGRFAGETDKDGD